MVRDSVDSTKVSKETLKLTVPVRYKITNTVLPSDGLTAITGASVYLKQSNHARQIVKSDGTGAFSFTNVLPGSYTIFVYKSGVTFGAAVPVTVTSADAAQNIKAIAP
jgi:predicted secreted protein